ncbi:hypothetical protein V3C99_003747 [Haemonchus contortus]
MLSTVFHFHPNIRSFLLHNRRSRHGSDEEAVQGGKVSDGTVLLFDYDCFVAALFCHPQCQCILGWMWQCKISWIWWKVNACFGDNMHLSSTC